MDQTGIIAIHQPNYLPWLGYFYKIHQSGTFVFLDDAQFSNKGMHNYCYIKTPQGPFRMKIPVHQSLGDKIHEVKVRDELDWKIKHLKTIETNYRKATYFTEVFSDLTSLVEQEYFNIAAFNSAVIRFFAGKLGIKTIFKDASELNLESAREQKILDICHAFGGNIYYSGTGARAYQDEKSFNEAGIELRYSEFRPFEYLQLWGEFQSNVSILDYLMNCGYNWEMIVRSQERP